MLLRPLLAAVAPVSGVWLDGTFGAGGYARGLLEAGADKVIGIDRDPLAHQMAASWAGEYGDRLRLEEGTFSDLDTLAGEPLDEPTAQWIADGLKKPIIDNYWQTEPAGPSSPSPMAWRKNAANTAALACPCTASM